MRLFRIALFCAVLFFPLMNATARTDYVFYHYFINSREDLVLMSETQSLFWTGPQDLTATGAAPTLDPSSALVGWGISQAPYVFYFDSNLSLQATYFVNGSWQTQNLSAKLNLKPPLSTSVLAGVGVGDINYIFYISSDQHVEEVWGTAPNWLTRDLTSLTGSPLAYNTGGLSAVYTSASNRYDVAYETLNSDNTLSLVDLYWPDANPWRYVNTGVPYGRNNSNGLLSYLSGYLWGPTNSVYFAYVNGNQVEYRFQSGGSWLNLCPFQCANNSAPPAPNTSLASVSAIEANYWSGDTFYINEPTGGFYELYEIRDSQYAGTWSLNNLSAISSIGGMPSANPPMTVFTGLSGIELFWVDNSLGSYGCVREAVMPPNQLNETWTGYGGGCNFNSGFVADSGSYLAGFSR